MAKRPKQKLTKMEKIERDIRLAHLKQERALRAIEKGKRDLIATARTLATSYAKKRRLEARAADERAKPAATMERQCNDIVPQPKPEDDWPAFCDRKPNAKDEAAKAEILAEQAEAKKARDARNAEKRKIKAEVKQAELTGKRRKMPLSGKAALAAISEG